MSSLVRWAASAGVRDAGGGLSQVIIPLVVAAGGRTPPTVRDKTSYASTAATDTSSVVPIPTNAQAGDVHYIFCELTASTGAITTPTGYTAVVPQFDSENSTSAESAVFRKDTTLSGGGGSVTISHSSGRFAAASLAVAGVDTGAFEDVAGASDNGPAGTATAVDAPSLTPANAGTLLLTGHTGRRATVGEAVTYTPPSGMTEEVDVSSAVAAVSNASVEVCSLAVTDTNATGLKTATADLAVSASGMAVLVRGLEAGGVSANAETATGTGTALDAQAAVSVTAEAASSAGTALDAQGAIGAQADAASGAGAAQDARTAIQASADQATGTGAAPDATAALAVNAEAAAGTGAAYDATVSTEAGTNAQAEVATGTGTAYDAQAALAGAADAAAGAGTAPAGTASIGAAPETATALGAAVWSVFPPQFPPEFPQAGAQTAIAVNAELASSTGTAYDATVSTAAQTNAQAEVATGTGVALDATVHVAVGAGVAIATGAALDAIGQAAREAPAGLATAAGTALDATAAVLATAEAALATGQALDATAFVPPPVPPPRWVEGNTEAAGLVEGVLAGVGVVEGGTSL